MPRKINPEAPKRGGRRPGAGRPASPAKYIERSVCLKPEHWAFLERHWPGESHAAALRLFLDATIAVVEKPKGKK